MAEIDPEKVGRSGIDPITGSILSQEVRNSLLKKTSFDTSVFRNDLLAVENRRRVTELENATVIQNQENVLIGFNSNIQALRSDVAKLGTGLANIALLLQQDNIEEQSRIRAEQEKQRRLTEQQIRIGKENEIEEKIQNAIVAPVQRLVPEVNNIFGRIGAALGILFGGWLTNQVVQAIKASEEKNTKLFNDIKSNIVKNLAIVGGGLVAIRVGFSLVKNTISRIASGLTRLLIAKPLALAAGLLRFPGFGGGGRKPPTSGPNPGGSGGIGGVGRFVTFLSGLMNLKNKEFIDTTLAALSLASRAPGPLGAIAKVAGIAFTADEIAEAFGKNIFTDTALNQKVNEIAQVFKKESKGGSSTTQSKPVPQSSTPTSSPVSPQTPMMGDQKPPPPSTTSAPSAERVSQFEKAWQYRNNPLARGRIESAWTNMSSEEKQQAKDWAKSKGYDWSEMKLEDKSSAKTSPTQTTSTNLVSSTNTEKSSQEAISQDTSNMQMISSAQMTAPPKEPVKVGQLPEPAPTFTMIKTSNNANQSANVPLTNGALSDVPLINSANPDNFYVLYSQLNYNVVQ